MGLVGRQVPDRHRHVYRLDHDATLPVQNAERVRELENIAKRLEIAVTTATLAISDVRSAVDWSKIHDVAADMQIALGMAGMQHESLRCMSELCIDDVAPEPHHLRRLVHQRTGLTEYL